MYTRRCTSTTVPRSGGVKPQRRFARRGWRSSRPLITRASVRRPVVFPSSLPCGNDGIGILGMAEASVIPPEGAEVIPFLTIQIVTKDPATVDEIRAKVEQIVL